MPRRKQSKKMRFPLKDAVILGGTVGVASAVTPSATPVYAILTPMAYQWYKTRHEYSKMMKKKGAKKKLKKVM
jgi:hypothetical protein